MTDQKIDVEIKDFVGVYNNAFSKEYCNKAIEVFDGLEAMGFSLSRQEHDKVTTIEKEDHAIFVQSTIPTEHLTQNIHQDFLTVFWNNCYPSYAEKYACLNKSSDNHTIYTNKMQRTSVGGGYHIWHYEASSRQTGGRLLSYILYLNDVEEGGETEFLYLHRRIKPTAGTLVLFPAAFTHTHRGNPPLSNTKYIMTGWVEF